MGAGTAGVSGTPPAPAPRHDDLLPVGEPARRGSRSHGRRGASRLPPARSRPRPGRRSRAGRRLDGGQRRQRARRASSEEERLPVCLLAAAVGLGRRRGPAARAAAPRRARRRGSRATISACLRESVTRRHSPSLPRKVSHVVSRRSKERNFFSTGQATQRHTWRYGHVLADPDRAGLDRHVGDARKHPSHSRARRPTAAITRHEQRRSVSGAPPGRPSAASTASADPQRHRLPTRSSSGDQATT